MATLITCLEAHARDAGLGDSAAYWLAAACHNQHELAQAEMPVAAEALPFSRALSHAAGCVSIVDEGGEFFTRVWCDYEAYLALARPSPASTKLAVYTAVAHSYTAPEGGGAHEQRFAEMRMAVGLLEGFYARDPVRGCHPWRCCPD